MRTLFEIREEMRCIPAGDPEANHSRADDLLIEGLRKMAEVVGGDPTLWPAEVEDLIESFNRIEKWYA